MYYKKNQDEILGIFTQNIDESTWTKWLFRKSVQNQMAEIFNEKWQGHLQTKPFFATFFDRVNKNWQNHSYPYRYIGFCKGKCKYRKLSGNTLNEYERITDEMVGFVCNL